MIESGLVFMVVCLFIYSCAYIDFEHLDDNDWIESHFSRFIQRASVIILLFLYNYKLSIGAGLLFAASFDQVLNSLRGLNFWYLGSTASWDLFFSRQYILTPTFRFNGNVILGSKYIEFNFKILYVSAKVLFLIGGLFFFVYNFYRFGL